jgi:CRP-like cAMP-binding protein
MIEHLKNLPHLQGVDSKVIENLVMNKQILQRSYNKGVTVHEQYTECYGMDIVLSGKLIAYSLASNGSETIVFEFNKHSIIGANLLFGEQNKYPMNIYSTTDCSIFHISKAAVNELLKEYSFVMQFVRSLSLNSQGMNKKIAMYTQKSLRENLTDYFIALSVVQKSKTIILPISKKQLADHFGVQRPSLFRELKRMKDDGLIEVNNRKIALNFLD